MASAYYPWTGAVVEELSEQGYDGKLPLELIGKYLDETIHSGEVLNFLEEGERQLLYKMFDADVRGKLGKPQADSNLIFDVASPDLIPELVDRRLRNFVLDMIRKILVDLATYSKYSKE